MGKYKRLIFKDYDFRSHLAFRIAKYNRIAGDHCVEYCNDCKSYEYCPASTFLKLKLKHHKCIANEKEYSLI